MGLKSQKMIEKTVVERAVANGEAEFSITELIDELTAKHRLTKSMVLFLLWRLKFASDAACARAVGISANTVHRWKSCDYTGYVRETPDFNGAYAELYHRVREVSEKAMAALMPRTVDVAKELLNATKKNVLSRGDGKAPDIIDVPDYENRYRGARVVTDWMIQKVAVQPNQTYIAIMSDFQQLLALKQRKLLEEGRVVDTDAVVTEVVVDHAY